MGIYIQALALIIVSILLLWFGYTLFVSPLSPFYPWIGPWKKWWKTWWKKRKETKGTPGEPQICPVCSTKMFRGELVKSVAFPSLTGGRDRLMYIKGCIICLYENVKRGCPVCGAALSAEDFLVSRMFERPGRKNHVHVLGCNKCKL